VIKITPKAGWMPKGKRGREIPINDEVLPVLLELRANSKGPRAVEKTNDKPHNRGLWLNFKRLATSGHNSAIKKGSGGLTR
jgi:hypothetical protein